MEPPSCVADIASALLIWVGLRSAGAAPPDRAQADARIEGAGSRFAGRIRTAIPARTPGGGLLAGASKGRAMSRLVLAVMMLVPGAACGGTERPGQG